MLTRTQYLNKECTHREYYSQFVYNHDRLAIRSRFTIERLIQAFEVGEDLNDIPLSVWDGLTQSWRNIIPVKMKECGDSMTQAGAVCIMKEAARQVIDEELKKKEK